MASSPLYAGVAEAVKNQESSHASVRARKFLLINIHKEGVFCTFTRSRQLKWHASTLTIFTYHEKRILPHSSIQAGAVADLAPSRGEKTQKIQ